MFVYVEDVSCCSAVCLCCAADKRAYMICNQFIEPAVSGGGEGSAAERLAALQKAAALSILVHGDLNGP